MSADAPRPIWLCADDYGISQAVSTGIRELIALRRLNATSVMVVARHFDRTEAAALAALIEGGRPAIGLHLTLTAPFAPLTAGFRPLRGGAFLPLGDMLARGSLRLLSPAALTAEIAAQVNAFAAAFGRAPDFIDGHQHVHLFPQVREALLAVMAAATPKAWVRQCGRLPAPLGQRLADKKALLLDALSRRFRVQARARGIATNPAFAGTYDFMARPAPDFGRLFPAFLRDLPAGSVVMCHPGHVDAELERLDPLTAQRESEHAFLSGGRFAEALANNGVALA